MATYGTSKVAGTQDGPKDAETASTREIIFRTIEENPGIHFRELCRLLNKQTGVIQYHLKVLETREGIARQVAR